VGRINRALEENRFRLHAQPTVPVLGGEGKGAHYELFLRLEEEDGSVVQPSEFMPAAERHDMPFSD
jgi:EAL domain-containing protein (putative c-di-GMP-specific phosphodiesterase class I)